MIKNQQAYDQALQEIIYNIRNINAQKVVLIKSQANF